MNLRGLALIVAGSALSCSYPEFAFVSPDDATSSDARVIFDTSVRPDQAEPEDTFDSANSDTAVVDTAANDTTGVDTLIVDSGNIDTGGHDTSSPVDTKPPVDAALGFCASSAHFFCNDFDSSSSEPTFGWTSSNLSGSGVVKLDTTTSKSGARSLRTTFAAPSGATYDAASVNRLLSAPAADSLTRFEADLMIDAGGYTGTEGTLLLKVQRTGGRGIGIGIDPGGFYLELVGLTHHWQQLPTKVPIGVWFHVRIEGKLLVAGGFAKVWIDSVLSADVLGKSTADVEGVSRNFIVGLYADAPIATFGARFDNVTVDFP